MSAPTDLRVPRGAQPVPTSPRLRSARVPLWAYLATLALVVGVLVAGAQAAGWFVTSGRTTAGTSERVVPSAGASTADIKGWMTVQQVLDAYPVTEEALYAQFCVPAGTPTSSTLAELKEIDGVTLDVPALRAWVDSQASATSP